MNYLTVVYAIKNQAAFKDESERLFANFKELEDGQPWSITTVSADHELQRLALIEEVIDMDEDDGLCMFKQIQLLCNLGDCRYTKVIFFRPLQYSDDNRTFSEAVGPHYNSGRSEGAQFSQQDSFPVCKTMMLQ